MPYAWAEGRDAAPGEPGAVRTLRLWPFRSLPPAGFALFFAATAALAALPLLLVLGTAVLWFVLVPMVAVVAGTWWALRLTYRSAEVEEELVVRPDRLTLTRRERRGGERRWEANPHWVRAALHPRGGPVPNYLTLSGAGRTVEIGAFLSEEERVALKAEIEDALRRAR
mgnify:CR=1 FL=1